MFLIGWYFKEGCQRSQFRVSYVWIYGYRCSFKFQKWVEVFKNLFGKKDVRIGLFMGGNER